MAVGQEKKDYKNKATFYTGCRESKAHTYLCEEGLLMDYYIMKVVSNNNKIKLITKYQRLLFVVKLLIVVPTVWNGIISPVSGGPEHLSTV